MITNDDYIIIEVLDSGIRITLDTTVERYINLSARQAETEFRNEYGLKGKRLKRICLGTTG